MKVKLLETLVLPPEHGCVEGEIFDAESTAVDSDDKENILEVSIVSKAGVKVILQNHGGQNHFEVVPE